MSKKAKNKVPELRFPEFHGDWETRRVDHFLVRYVNPVKVEPETIYKEIGIRSHGKGIFHKDPVTGEALGNKRVYWVHSEAFTVNIVFAWEQAVALTSSDEQGYIASHRFLMFLPKENRADLKFVLLFFLRKRGKHLLELASPGGAGRNKTLGQDSFAELEITLPKKEEQQKIASFLGAVDTRLNQLRRKRELLQTYKRGVMQKIFAQKIRFKSAIGSPFPDWESKKLEKIGSFLGGGTPSTSQQDYWIGNIPWVSSSDLEENSIHKISITRFINQTAIEESATKIIPPNSILIVSRVGVGKIAVSSKSLCTSQDFSNFTPKEGNIYFLAYWFVAHKKKLISISQGTSIKGFTNSDLSLLRIDFPYILEQEKIANFLTAIDRKIETLTRQIEQTEQFKKGLLQKLFV